MSRTLYGLPAGCLLAIILHSAITPLVLMTAPAVAAQYGGQLGLNAGQIGFLFSAELAAMSLATLPAYLWQKRMDWRCVAGLAGLLFVCANIASAIAETYALLIALRFLSALGGGTLMVIGMASAALSPERDKVYGLWVLGQLALGAIGLWVLPGLFAGFGLSAFYVGLAVLMAAALPLARFYPATMSRTDVTGAARLSPTDRGKAAIGIFGLLLFYVGLSGVWTFISGIATNAGLDSATTGQLLSVATILGIVGALTATLTGGLLPRTLALAVGYGVMAGSILLLLGLPTALRFAVAAFLFKFIWTYVLPFILGTISGFDTDGRLMSTANLVVGGGLAIGPALAGQILQRGGGFPVLLWTSAMLITLSFVALMLTRRAPTPDTTATLEPAE